MSEPLVRSIRASQTVQTEMNLQTLALTDTLYAYRMNSSRRMLCQDGEFRLPILPGDVQVSEGVMDADNLANFEAGRQYKTNNLVIFPSDLIEEIRLYGWHYPWHEETAQSERVRRDIFSAILSSEATLANLVSPDFGNFYFTNYAGKPLPVGLSFSYMNGQFDEAHYDLGKAAAHLLTRPDVTLARRTEGFRLRKEYEFGGVTDPADAILDVPFYNSRPGRRRHLAFRWAPSVADYDRMVADVGRDHLGLTDRFYHAAFDLDLLGLRAAGAALFDDYFASQPEVD